MIPISPHALSHSLPEKTPLPTRALPLLLSAGLAFALALTTGNAQISYYWNGADISANPAAGGDGNWDTMDAWRIDTVTGAAGTWTAGTTTHAAILGGTAGTIRLSTAGTANFEGSSLTVNTTGYIVAESGSDHGPRGSRHAHGRHSAEVRTDA